MNRTYEKMNDLITEISMGPFGSDIKVEYFVDKGIPVLNGSNISGFKITDDFKNYVTEERASGYRKAIAVRGDIVITHRGTLGQIAYVPDDSQYEKYVISQSQFKVRLDTKKVNPVYFTYYFHTNEGQQRLLSFKSHVGVPALAQATTNFRLLDFPLIPKPKQDAIASVLETLDKKIELNNQINAELEAMTKTLYDYWFVQFDFPNADGKPYKSSGGKIVYSETLKREVPEGWAVSILDNIISIYDSKRVPLSSKQRAKMQGHIPYYGATSVMDYVNDYIFDGEYVLLAEDGSVMDENGFPILQFIEGKAWVNNHAHVLKGTNGFSNPMLHQTLKNIPVINIMSGSIQKKINQNNLKNTPIFIPPQELLNLINPVLINIYTKILLAEKESIKLESLRDWLLPMLMNGQVTVN